MDNYYNKGDKVWILNRDLSGKWHVEGRATVLSVAEGTDRYKVKFNGSGRVYNRHVDSVAQNDPHKYVDALNKWHNDLEKRSKEANTLSM